MRLIKATFLLLFILLTNEIIIGQNLNEFKSILNNCGMIIKIPDGYNECKIISNNDMNYEYSIKYDEKDFEVRYAVRPITYKKYANEEVKKELEGQKEFRNSQYEIIFKTVMLNITGGKEYKYTVFGTDGVKKEFNADWGATTFVDLNPSSEFGKGYKYCMIVTIHKKDKADAYYFYLANTKENFMDNAKPLFHSLKFE